MSTDIDRLIDLLISEGWREDSEWIVSPHETMWLNRFNPWNRDGADFLTRMKARLNRILLNEANLREAYGKSSSHAADDTRSLIKCLEETFKS